ncbi:MULTISPECIES: tyrosine--tRNA ligase [unclassified Paenibacillus]|uniref:tyrosine--tRNA ligase n=1 Tax=unclassified Paenibacillus TaxID=185978 RepID=UPI0009547F1D|nr:MULTISPECIES: tyrosine--tRNA ligase [unclassified Paenibacillus]ASS65860.1 tyrosine--tRNA ligase [Paenibacillus sp. RUD330]SIQ21034.1 tyrosyl-tRNA synthetase [Paenibacillus sp. RU4X]SIQ42725.1 tyrosyl-tRNA synthetase [Paenibacillus sp. RU4T]
MNQQESKERNGQRPGSKLTSEQRQEVARQLAILARGTAEIIPESGLREKLEESVATGIPLKVKLGLDPSAPDIHIGHTVVLQKLRQFQECGHEVQLLIGDFTGRIGDPSGKSETRKALSEEDVRHNAQTYKNQIFKVLDPERTTVCFNSEWLSPLTFNEVIGLAAKSTVARMLERDDFTKRYRSNLPISIHEFFYPLMQGYDSVALETDIELGGTDQKFNLLMGRSLQKEYGKRQQTAITMPILEGLDGVQKMSKSLGNYIGIQEEPEQIFGKAMSMPDGLMPKYFELATDLDSDRLAAVASGLEDGTLHPRDAKLMLAHALVRLFHGLEAADFAESRFRAVFSEGALPDDIEEAVLHAAELEDGKIRLVKLLTVLDLLPSGSEARRSVQQGAVKLNGAKLEDVSAVVEPREGDVLQAGKRRMARIRIQL